MTAVAEETAEAIETPEAEADAPKSKKKKTAAKAELTTYVILRQDPGTPTTWLQIDAIDAANATDAVKKIVASQEDQTGSYLAVPARSWKPVTVRSETQTKIVVS